MQPSGMFPDRRETAEMPGMYSEGEYDIAGFTVGIVDKSKMINGSNIAAGDAVIGLASSGVHSNGFSLVRKRFWRTQATPRKSFRNWADVLATSLAPTKIYEAAPDC